MRLEDSILFAFLLNKQRTFRDIRNYIVKYYDKTIENQLIDDIIKKYLKGKKPELKLVNGLYELTEEGNVVMKDIQEYYRKRVIKIWFYWKEYKTKKESQKKYKKQEIREEQSGLRKYLIQNKKPQCVICDKKLPLELLETAHLKPRNELRSDQEKNNCHVVEFMCCYCHKLYDSGFLGINNGLLCVSSILLENEYDLKYENGKKINCFNSHNIEYFEYHIQKIFKN